MGNSGIESDFRLIKQRGVLCGGVKCCETRSNDTLEAHRDVYKQLDG
jgi:hypothetical protein